MDILYFYDLSCFNMEKHSNVMYVPNIYDLSHFNKKTHNIVVSIRYNMKYNHLEITYDGITTITDDFHLRKEDNMIMYDSGKSSIIMDLTHKNLVGFYIRNDRECSWSNINYHYMVTVLPNDGLNIYFHKTNIPPFFLPVCSYSNIYPFSHYVNGKSIPFILFSNDMIDPVPYFDITKMKYIKQCILDVMVNCKLVYIVYKSYNMIFIYNSHIIYNDTKLVFTSWNDKHKKFNCNFNIIPPELYLKCSEIDFAPIISDYKYGLIYRYS